MPTSMIKTIYLTCIHGKTCAYQVSNYIGENTYMSDEVFENYLKALQEPGFLQFTCGCSLGLNAADEISIGGHVTKETKL